MGDDDCNRNDSSVPEHMPVGKSASDTEGQNGTQERFDAGDYGCSGAVSHDGFKDSTTSLTASSDCVCFVGDESRLELFPVDEFGRAIASRPMLVRPVRQGIIRYIDLCRNRCSIDIMYVCVLSLLSLVIILVLILDN